MLHETFLPLKLFLKPIADLSENEVLQGCSIATQEHLREITERHSNIPTDPKRYPRINGETREEWKAAYDCMMRKKNALQQAKMRLNEEFLQNTIYANNAFMEKSVMENLHRVRFSVGASVSLYKNGLITDDCVPYYETSSPIIPVKCKSGVTRNVDLRKLKRIYWEEMVLNRGKPKTFIVEPEGYIDRRSKILSTCWQKMQEYNDEIAHIEVTETLIILKVV